MTFELDRRCLICGARIDDNNSDGIGYTCRKLYPEAENLVIMSDEENKWEIRNIKMNVWMNEFSNYCNSKKFRSQFKKDFSKSILEQWNNSHRLSNKQFDIVRNMLISDEIYRGDYIAGGLTPTEYRLNQEVSEKCKEWKSKYFMRNENKREEVHKMMIVLWQQNGSKVEESE